MAEDGEPTSNESAHNDAIIRAGLVQGLSYSDVGRLAGVSAKTVQRRMADPGFAAGVAAARSDRAQQITDRLRQLGEKAVAVFDEAMAKEHPINVRLAAAGASLRHLREYRAGTEIDERLRELEELTTRLLDVIGDGRDR